MKPRTSIVSLVVATMALAGSCKNDDDTNAPVPPDEPAKRSAVSFVHCVESGSSGCVRSGQDLGGWDAFFLLGWLADGSPTSILQALGRELRKHADPMHVQGRFVQLVERYQPMLRGAECDPVGAQGLGPLVKSVAEVAQRRLTTFGLWSAEMAEVVKGLHDEAGDGLRNGYLISMQCRSEPYQLYLATAQRGNRQEIMGLTLMLPKFLSGEGANRDTRGRDRGVTLSQSRSIPVTEGTVHAWIPIQMEDF